MDKTTQEKITDILVELLGVDPSQVVPSAKFEEDLAADSLDSVEILISVEEEFDVEIEDEDAEKCKTVQDLVDLVTRKLAATPK